jgi:tetratricopeptide (TPR) repeat protein
MVLLFSTKRDIEEKLKKLGDYVKIDYLGRCLKENPDFETRKFILLTLSKLYEDKGMFAEAAKQIRNAADINSTFNAKIADFMKAAELFAKASDFGEVDISVTKALASANTMQRAQIKTQQKQIYMAQAQALVKKDKRSTALKAYEKILTFELTPNEKKDVQITLLGLYEKLGKVREFYSLKRSM